MRKNVVLDIATQFTHMFCILLVLASEGAGSLVIKHRYSIFNIGTDLSFLSLEKKHPERMLY